jgi:hypothetical protein
LVASKPDSGGIKPARNHLAKEIFLIHEQVNPRVAKLSDDIERDHCPHHAQTT